MTTSLIRLRRWVFCLLAGMGLALLLQLGPWTLIEALAIGAAVSGLVAVVWQRSADAIADPQLALDLLTDRLKAAAAGDFHSPAGLALNRAAPRQAPIINAALHRLRTTVDRANTLAFQDAVTTLPNRLHFRRSGEAALAALRESEPAAVLFVDLDRFKSVNDTMGHAHGDILLMRVAQRMKEQVEAYASAAPDRPAPLIGRLAGDEFTLLVPGGDRAVALAMGRDLLLALRLPLLVGSRTVSIGASIGVALAPEHGATLGSLLRAADDAMYAAKAAGRGRVVLFDEAMAARRLRTERVKDELSAALAAGDFSLAFQPQRQLSDGRTHVIEALLRWGPANRPPQRAADFLPVAEETGLIGPIGEWVAGAAARQLAEWQAAGYRGRLAVNLSPGELEQPDALACLESALGLAGARLEGLEIEIGEAGLSRASADAIMALSELRRRGVTVTIEGFGGGHTPLKALADLPIDRVKLDVSIVRDLARQPAARVVASSAIGLAQGLGRDVVAAGVETAEQLELVSAMGVDAVQGFHIARPTDAAGIARWTYEDSDRAESVMAR